MINEEKLAAFLRIAKQLNKDNPTRPVEVCFADAYADWLDGAITDSYLDFCIKHPDATIVMNYGDK